MAAPAPIAAPAPVPAPAAAPGSEASVPAATAGETDDQPRGFIPQNSLAGSVGLLRMGAAEVGRLWQFRLGLHGEYFSTDKMLIESGDFQNGGDTNTRFQGALTFGLTPLQFMEIFGAVSASGNKNTRCLASQTTQCISEAGRTDPEIIKAFGDLILGTKVAYALPMGLSIGGELGVRLMSSVGGLTFSGDSTSVWINALASWDFQALAPVLPLRAHLNLGMYFDNSYKTPQYPDGTTVYSRYVSSFAYGLGKDRFRLAFGLDAPVADLGDWFSLRPMLEYHFEYITADGDPNFAAYGPDCTSTSTSCRNNRSQMWMTLGLQAQMVHSLTLMLGVDLELEAAGYPYGPPLAPWNFLFGVSYPLDTVPRVVTRKIAVEKVVAAPAREGTVAGRLVSTVGTPVEGAVVGVTGRGHSRVLAEADGTFRSVPLEPGLVELLVVAPNYENATAKVEVVAGQTANMAITMTPRAPAAKIAGRVTEESGKPVVATVRLAGPQIAEAKTDDAGNLSIAVQAGQYALRVEADQYLSREMSIEVREGMDTPLNVIMHARPAVAGVVYKDGKITLRQPISFKAKGNKPTAEFAPGATRVLDEVVDLLINHPEIRQIRVETHTDNSLPPAKAQELTNQQAQTIADYISKQDVPKDHVAVEGMGSTKPRAPNLGKAGKLKNRRVEIVVAQ